MTTLIQAAREVPVRADLLWQTVRQMTGMEDWYPSLIQTSSVRKADTDQPHRICIMQDGGELYERILLRDDATRTFVYAIDSHPLPAKNVVGTIRIDPLENGKSHVSWSAYLVLDPGAEHVAGVVKGMYDAGLAALEAFHTS